MDMNFSLDTIVYTTISSMKDKNIIEIRSQLVTYVTLVKISIDVDQNSIVKKNAEEEKKRNRQHIEQTDSYQN